MKDMNWKLREKDLSSYQCISVYAFSESFSLMAVIYARRHIPLLLVLLCHLHILEQLLIGNEI